MNLQQLATFCAILNEGSMTAAAEKLFLTQPAVSQQVRNLEDELGVELLVRGVRQVKPSIQGQLLYEYAKKIIHLTKQAEVAIQSMKSDIRGDLKIGTLNSIGMYLVSPVVGLFLKTNRELSVNMVYGAGSEIIEAMKNGDVDVVIMPDVKTEYGESFTDYESKFLFKDELWLVGSGRDTNLPRQISIEELVGQPLVKLNHHYPGFDSLLKTKFADKNIDMKFVVEGTNAGALKRIIESGFGWGFLPAHSIRKQVQSRRLTHVHCEDIKYTYNINFYTKIKSDSQGAAEVLYRAIQQQTLR